MSNQLLDAALAYAAKGLPVFPANAVKEPLIAGGVNSATTDPAKIRSWWTAFPRANIGFDVGGAGMMCVEIDSYKPDFDPAKLAALDLPETQLRSRSPRGGEHRFYALKEGEIVSASQSKLAPCVDVRSFHSYVLLPPSRTADGPYLWEGEGKPAYRTDEMVRLANSHREKSATRDRWLIEPDLPQNVAAAVEWLKTEAKIAVEGQGGDGMAYATAAAMRSFGISEATAFDLLWTHWNPRCVPPWGADDYEHLESKVQHAYEYSTSDPGNMTSAYREAKSKELFKPVTSDQGSGGREATAGRFRAVDREGMANIRPASWLVEEFLPRDAYTMLVGAPGTFKTFLALDVALTVATGLASNPTWTATECGPVLYAAGEGRSAIANRVAAWERAHWHGEKTEGFVLIDPVPNVGEDWTPFIEAALALSPGGYKLVVIDTVGRAMAGLNENAQQDASKLTQQVGRLQHELGCTVLCLHHIGHENKHRPRGSMVFHADVDTLVRIDREDSSDTVELSMLKQKDAPEWTHPRQIKLAEISLGSNGKSLAAVPVAAHADDVSKPAAARKPKNQYDEAKRLIQRKLYAEIVEAVLATNKVRNWSQRALAINVANDKRVDVSAKTLENTYLTELRETPEFKEKGYFDPATMKWHYRA